MSDEQKLLIDSPRETVVVDDTNWPEIERGEAPDEEINRTIHSLGMQALDIRHIRGHAKIAKWLKKCGMVEISRGMLAHRMHSLSQARAAMLDLVLDPTEDKHIRVSAANIMHLIVKAENSSTELDLKLESLALERTTNTKPQQELPPPGMNVMIVNTPTPNTPVEKVVKSA